MGTSSKLVALFLVLIVLLLPLISLLNNGFSIQTISHLVSFHGKPNHSSNEGDESRGWRKGFIGFKDKPSSIFSGAVSFNVSKCFPIDLPENAITSDNCCPGKPFPSKFMDFKDFAPPNATLRVRKPAHLIDEEYIAKLEKGIALMKALPRDDPRNFIEQAKVHCAYCNGAYHLAPPFQHIHLDVHRSWLFFPFHRWYIFFVERMLGKLIGDPSFALPYWNWDSPEGMHIPSYFTIPNSSLHHKLRNYMHMPPHVVDLVYNINDPDRDNYTPPPQQQVKYNLATMYKQMILASTKELFMGSPLRLGDNPRPGPGSIELAPHNTVHDWTGAVETPNHEDMGAFYTAARDPVFYSHHSNLDRMWYLWSKLGGEGRRGYADDPDWLDTEFFFYNEDLNLVRVKVRDCLDTKKLGYVYEDADLPWLRTPPVSRKNKLLRQANKASLRGSKPSEFPLLLDSIKSTIVKRPKKLRSKEEKEQEEEVLVIEGIEFGSDKFVKFDVHVDDDEDKLSAPDETEFVGCFVSLRHGRGDKISTNYKVGISKVLESLEAEEDDDVLVTLVPNVGKGDVVIRSIKIEFLPKN